MIKYEAEFTYTDATGQRVSGRRTFTYPCLVIEDRDLRELAEYLIGLLVSRRELRIISVRLVSVTIDTELV